MPPVTRLYVRSSFLYLVATLATGLWIAARAVWPELVPGSSALSPVYFHLFMVGWVTQLIFGIAYWMFPVYSRDAPRRSKRLGHITYYVLNGGLLLRIAGELAATESGGWRWLTGSAAVLLFLAGVGFVVNTWGRVTGR